MHTTLDPTLMLLGDSIRIIYQPLVAGLLEGQARVVAPSENGRFALHTLQALELMERHNVPVNDLNAVVRANIDAYLPANDHHVNADGAAAYAWLDRWLGRVQKETPGAES